MLFRLTLNLCQPVALMFGGQQPEDKETWLVYQEVKLLFGFNSRNKNQHIHVNNISSQFLIDFRITVACLCSLP